MTALRKAKDPAKPGQIPDIHSRDTFDQWMTTYLSNVRQIGRDKERFFELQRRNGYNPRSFAAKRRLPTSWRTPRGSQPNNSNKSIRSNAGNLNRDGPDYNRERNPHSPLTKPTTTITMHPTVNNRPKVKCFNCNMHGHFASKCPEPKRPRHQRFQQLRANMAGIHGDYSLTEANKHNNVESHYF